MDGEDSPTVLTVADIDNFLKMFEESLKQPEPMTYCTSCSREMHLILVDSYTGQCQECFYAKKPWVSSSPVSYAYFMMNHEL